MNTWICSSLSAGFLLVAGCERAATGPSPGELPKQMIDAAEATRAETERKQEEQRQAIKASLGEPAPAPK
jgi:hypothetical protein